MISLSGDFYIQQIRHRSLVVDLPVGDELSSEEVVERVFVSMRGEHKQIVNVATYKQALVARSVRSFYGARQVDDTHLSEWDWVSPRSG